MTAARRTGEIAIGILPILAVIALWHGIAMSGIAPAVLLPPPAAVFAMIIIIGAMGIILDAAFERLRASLVKWSEPRFDLPLSFS